jgi:hypothetical protein
VRASCLMALAMRLISSLLLAPFTAIALFACSGIGPGDNFPSPPAKPNPPPSVDNGDAGDLVNGPGMDAGSSAPAVCDPAATTSFQPAWQAPEAWKQNVCSATQITGFYAACLTPPISAQTCQTFVQANANCAPCLQSQETDTTSSAIVWHEQDRYWTVNVAGCIARATGDATSAGCGAVYGAAIACRQASCNACWEAQGTSATFQQFSDCESLAGSTTCQTYAQAVPTKCGTLDQGPASVCMPSSSATAQGAYMQIAPLFCGQ